ncbi:carboxymuconolactone decarboxylase family protein [Kitasatospora phosalacinea]|uniref:Carboxymuconolactone decarboxylase family protein n=1 Tax=Kitasatospora phosalacinea TaxID=2065 RepID=A0ABW6GNC2_9ACTN
MNTAATPTTRQERLDHGLEVLRGIDGDAGTDVLASLADVSPELAHQVAAWGFGEIYARPALPPRERQLVTLGMLTALGGCEPQLRVHVNASLNVGLTPQEIVEALLHSAVYCGFPRALNATFAAKQVFAERGLLPVAPAAPAPAPTPAAPVPAPAA